MIFSLKHLRVISRLMAGLISLSIGELSAQTNAAPTNSSFDGHPWNVSTGNLSVMYIQASPVGAFPRTNFIEAPPSVESLAHLKSMGLVADEDYVGWGAVERAPGQWNWEQHDAMEKNLHAAGLKYVAYTWVHFPPVWLRDAKDQRTLMRCTEHGQEANYLSVFDPRTIQWYDHFYKNLHDHFGDKIDDVYACILGPYGEGNYPLYVESWVNMGHCHEGYWCADDFAIKAFQKAMKAKYSRIGKLNAAWGDKYKSFDEIRPPKELATEKFKPTLEIYATPEARRRWLDFIRWYHQAIVDFSEQSLKTVIKYFPADRVRIKPGGSSGSINPLTYGTYCPAYAKMVGPYKGVVIQPADCQGAIFADKWMGTAYQFYGAKECTEPASGLDDKSFVRRMFSDASSGATQLFTYEFEQHARDIQKYIHLFNGKSGDTEIAVFCPTTFYQLGGNLHTTIANCAPLRDLCEFDVLDELLITDGALTTQRYKTLVIFQADVVDQPILDKISQFRRAGGKVILVGDLHIQNVEGRAWPETAKLFHVPAIAPNNTAWLHALAAEFIGYKGTDGQFDGLWTSERGHQRFIFNSTAKLVKTRIHDQEVEIAPYTIWNDAAGSTNWAQR